MCTKRKERREGKAVQEGSGGRRWWCRREGRAGDGVGEEKKGGDRGRQRKWGNQPAVISLSLRIFTMGGNRSKRTDLRRSNPRHQTSQVYGRSDLPSVSLQASVSLLAWECQNTVPKTRQRGLTLSLSVQDSPSLLAHLGGEWQCWVAVSHRRCMDSATVHTWL